MQLTGGSEPLHGLQVHTPEIQSAVGPDPLEGSDTCWSQAHESSYWCSPGDEDCNLNSMSQRTSHEALGDSAPGGNSILPGLGV